MKVTFVHLSREIEKDKADQGIDQKDFIDKIQIESGQSFGVFEKLLYHWKQSYQRNQKEKNHSPGFITEYEQNSSIFGNGYPSTKYKYPEVKSVHGHHREKIQ